MLQYFTNMYSIINIALFIYSFYKYYKNLLLWPNITVLKWNNPNVRVPNRPTHPSQACSNCRVGIQGHLDPCGSQTHRASHQPRDRNRLARQCPFFIVGRPRSIRGGHSPMQQRTQVSSHSLTKDLNVGQKSRPFRKFMQKGDLAPSCCKSSDEKKAVWPMKLWGWITNGENKACTKLYVYIKLCCYMLL